MSTEGWIAFGAFIAGLIPYGLNLVSHYSNSQQKRYAAERDFQHLKRNQEQIVENIAHIAKDFDDRFDDIDRRLNNIDNALLEIKTYLNIHRVKRD
ncbi:MAG: hypothetical protein KME22_09025 [Hassallia sp. WJT32-NPBG1]|jgi:hypothetical protein|nr:hypothetical protein [Hassallia sp. WJT32-NPBG1]